MSENETKIPKFANETEEAAWWFNNQDYVLSLFEKAKAEGRLGHGTVARQMAEKQAAKSATIRFDPPDLPNVGS